MPRIERTAEVVWEGNVARGIGAISAGTGAFTGLEFSLPTRIGAAEGKTSPEELLAAAHGGCITMSLASELTQAGTPPGRLAVTCLIVMDEVEGQGHQIVASHVEHARDGGRARRRGAPGRRRQGRQGLPVLEPARARRRRRRRLRAARLNRWTSPELVRARRTHKEFGPEPVPRETLLELFDLARLAPNHHLTQPWRFRVLGPETLARLKEVGGPKEAPKLDRAPTLVVVSARADRRARPGRGGRLRRRRGDRRIVLLAATERGLASYWRTPGVLRTTAGREAVGVPDGERVLGLLHLGPRRASPRRASAAPRTASSSSFRSSAIYRAKSLRDVARCQTRIRRIRPVHGHSRRGPCPFGTRPGVRHGSQKCHDFHASSVPVQGSSRGFRIVAGRARSDPLVDHSNWRKK